MPGPGAMGRREFLAAAGGLAALGLAPSRAQSAAQGRSDRLSFVYRADPARIGRMLPLPLTPAKEPLVRVDFSQSSPAEPALLTPGDYGWMRVLAAAKHGDREGWFLLSGWTSHERGRLVAREKLGMPVFPGAVTFTSAGPASRAELALPGGPAARLETGEAGELRETKPSGPLFVMRFGAGHDWTNAGAVRAPVLLTLEDWDDSGEARVCPLDTVRFQWLERSPRQPASELDVAEAVEAWRSEAPAATVFERAKGEAAGTAERGELAPWLPLRYPRLVASGRPWRPAGWPEDSTAATFSPDEMRRFRGRKELIVGPLDLMEFEVMISREVHEQLLPPPLRGAGRPMLKILGTRIDSGDLSPQPYDEVWLFAFCVAEGRAAWYTLSHVTSAGGDAVYGREAFGYPSRLGEPEVLVTPVDCILSGARLGREFVYAEGGFGNFSTGTSLAQLPVVSLAVSPGERRGRLIYQMWHYQGRRHRVMPETMRIEFPEGAVDGLDVYPDPWFELNPIRPAAASAMDQAFLQRSPAEEIAVVENFEPFYRERCDGVLPWEEAPAADQQPSFFPAPPSATKS